VNGAGVLDSRIETCIAQRGLVPTIVAVDFSEKGGFVNTLRKINAASVREVRGARDKLAGTASSSPRPTGVIETIPTTVAGAPPTTAAPGASAAPPVPPGSEITTITGGDPAVFCPAVPTALHTILAWAEAALGEGPSDAGLADFAYGPVLSRVMDAYVASAPLEVAAKAEPLHARATAAAAALANLGVKPAEIQQLADQAAALLASPDSPDGVTIEETVLPKLEQSVPADRLRAAALVFSAGQPDPSTVLDLGNVSDRAARTPGWEACPDVVARI